MIGKGRVDNSKGSFLDLFYLVIEVRGEVVEPRFACIFKDRSNARPIDFD
jgi:hypothetical protein